MGRSQPGSGCAECEVYEVLVYIGELSQGEWKGELTWTMGFRAGLDVVAEPREWVR